MKQSVEKQIKQAFDTWDEQKSAIGFDKAVLWDSIAKPKQAPTIRFTCLRVASVAIILFLSAACLYFFQVQQALEQSNKQLALELQQAGQSVPPVVEKSIETKLVYQTQIKEVESPQMKAALAELTHQFESIQKENLKLKQEVQQFETSFAYLNDSIKSLEGNWAVLEKAYALELEHLKVSNQNAGFSIDINEEALLALSELTPARKPIKQTVNKRLKIKFKNSMTSSEATTPLFRDLGIK